MNYFEYETAAQRYARGRPYFHPIVVEKIVKFTQTPRFSFGLDVACGTGQSTTALKTIADRVVGADVSPEMIAQAPEMEGIEYICCPAESLDIESGSGDIMTVSLAFHWLDRDAFLNEANRALQKGGWLVISNNGFKGRMRGNPSYEEWNKTRYLTRYPTPARNKLPLTEKEADKHGFEIVGNEKYENEVDMNIEELACYLSTQSNMIAAVEEGKESVETALAWLSHELESLFSRDRETFLFGGSILYLKKRS